MILMNVVTALVIDAYSTEYEISREAERKHVMDDHNAEFEGMTPYIMQPYRGHEDTHNPQGPAHGRGSRAGSRSGTPSLPVTPAVMGITSKCEMTAVGGGEGERAGPRVNRRCAVAGCFLLIVKPVGHMMHSAYCYTLLLCLTILRHTSYSLARRHDSTTILTSIFVHPGDEDELDEGVPLLPRQATEAHNSTCSAASSVSSSMPVGGIIMSGSGSSAGGIRKGSPSPDQHSAAGKFGHVRQSSPTQRTSSRAGKGSGT